MTMSQSQFDDGLDRYGADLDRWPPALRSEAVRLIEISAEARASRDAMAAVESFLRSTAHRAKPPVDAVAARAIRHRQIRPARPATRRAAWAAAAATALFLGLVIGNVLPQHDGNPNHLMSAAFDPMEFANVD